jgi:broad specificity phosphatase PhoE
MSTLNSMNNPSSSNSTTKRVLFLRHGQAMHNPRAEEARSNGCSHETFLQLMKEDDAFDADLTKLGESQAAQGREASHERLKGVQLVVSSPLTRAIKTADFTICPENGLDGQKPPRVCLEDFREINGWLLNAKRRERVDLQNRFHSSWDFSLLSDDDETWTATLETEASCAERGYQGMLWLRDRSEDKILTVAHGGLLRFCMVDHPNIRVIDDRPHDGKRFGNCELREYEMTWTADCENDEVT